MPSLDQAQEWYRGADAVHDFDHVLRVLALAERIARVEGADPDIVRAAVLLHDAALGENDATRARSGHHERSADIARQVLAAEGWQAERVERVVECILAHRFRETTPAEKSLEAKVVYDADKLDAIGVVGAARAIAFAALHGNPFYREPSARFRRGEGPEPGEVHSAQHEFEFKLERIPERLNTKSARAIGRERLRVLREFFARLGEESHGRA
ncbi:MAG: hypothetical protein A2Z30_04460 [Chloroflexi bacterium RBG_16_64_43]|nr:MAG: hypothetical protein A2Z30_04460 [Chloroflexi bacterium RBG_16_64_43]